jgi:serine/threonine-protein kinase
LVGGLSDFVVIPPEELWGPLFPRAEVEAQLVIGGSIARADADAERELKIGLNLQRADDASRLGERQITGSVAALPELQASLVTAAIQMLAAEFGNVEYAPIPVPTQDPFAEARFERGLSWMGQGNSVETLERAIGEFEAAIAIDSEFADAYAHLGRAKLALYPLTRDPTRVYLAEGDCDRAIELGPGLADGWLCRAWVNVRLNTNDLALQAFVKSIERGATVEGHRGLGHVYRRLGYSDLAEDYLRGALELAPGYAGAHMSLGFFYGERGEYDTAEAAYLDATRWPDPLAWLSLGAMRYMRGNYEEAIEALESSLEVRETADAHSNLGLAYMLQGRFQEAITSFDKAVSLRDPSFMHFGNLGRAYWLAGESAAAQAPFAAARQHAQAQIAMDDRSTAWAIMPYYALRLDGESEARRVLDQALRARPDYNETYFWAAIVWSELGERERALDAIEEALERGYSRTEIRDTPELASLRGEPSFQRLVNGDQN